MRFLNCLFFLVILSLGNVVFALSGKEVFDNYCTTCHSPAMAPMFNAPPAQDAGAWDVRKKDAFDRAVNKNSSISKSSGEEKYEHIVNELLSTAKEGTPKGMPPKGTCMDCSDDELKSVIVFMAGK